LILSWDKESERASSLFRWRSKVTRLTREPTNKKSQVKQIQKEKLRLRARPMLSGRVVRRQDASCSETREVREAMGGGKEDKLFFESESLLRLESCRKLSGRIFKRLLERFNSSRQIKPPKKERMKRSCFSRRRKGVSKHEQMEEGSSDIRQRERSRETRPLRAHRDRGKSRNLF